MADIKKASINDQDGRQKILEGLWLIGIDPSQLNVDPGLDQNAFLDALHKNGVDDGFISRAMQGVDWRAPNDNSPLSQRVADLMRTSGYRQDEIDSFLSNARQFGGTGTTESASGLMGILTQQFNDRTAGSIMYKVTGGQDIKGAAWNPFRTDLPPKNANVNYGSMGKMATQFLQPGTVGRENEPVGQYGGLPIPPTPRQQAAAAPPPPPGPVQPVVPPGSGTTPAPGAGPGSSTIPVPGPVSPEDMNDYIKKNAGADGWFYDIPEVRDIIDTLASQPGSLDSKLATFEQKIETTDWWKNTSSQARAFHAGMQADPASWATSISQTAESVGNYASSEGIALAPERLNAIATNAVQFGWTQQQIHTAVAADFNYDPKNAVQGTTAQNVKKMAGDMLVPITDQGVKEWTQGIMDGKYTTQTYQSYLNGQAKTLFPWMGDSIDSGMSVRQYLSPYQSQIANTLEIDPNQIDWTKDQWRSLLSTQDPKTGQPMPTTLTDVDRAVKQDPKYGWDKTSNALSTAATTGQGIMRQFGLVA